MKQYILILVIIFLRSFTVFGQSDFYKTRQHIPLVKYENLPEWQKRMAQRASLGLTFPTMGLTADNHFVAQNSNYVPNIDTTYRLKKRSGFGIGFIDGNFFPLREYAIGSIIALDVTFTADVYTWKFAYIPALGLNQADKCSIAQYALPVSLVYKHGGDAMLSQTYKYMYSFGVGIQPLDAQTNYFGQSQNVLLFRPFISLEGGVLGGRAWKLRAVYYPVNSVFLNQTGHLDDNTLTAKITGSSDLKISLLVMLRSNYWGG